MGAGRHREGRGLRALKWAPVIWLLCENVKSGKWKMANMSPSIVKNYAQRKASVSSKWQLYVCYKERHGAYEKGSETLYSHASMYDCGLGWQLWSNGVLMAL